MTRDEAIAEVQEGLGFRTDLQDNIVRRMQRVQRLLEMGRTLPWFLVVEDQTLAVAADNPVVSLPANFIREVEYKRGLYFVPTTGVNPSPTFLNKMSLDEARTQYSDITGERPSAYAIRSSSFYLFPIPTVSFSLKLDYYAHATVLDTDVENSWLAEAPDVMIGLTGVSMAATLNNATAQKEFQELAGAAMKALQTENILRETANRRYLYGRIE